MVPGGTSQIAIFSDHFSRHDPGVSEALRETLLARGDHYMHLADLGSYLAASTPIPRPGRARRS
jgi:hypothetical protein